jgi:hypothetical protein
MGLTAGAPNPSLMIAVNDEGTGMVLDAISHSPSWQDTLVVVVEDDPSTASITSTNTGRSRSSRRRG